MTTRDGLPTMTTFMKLTFNFLLPEAASIHIVDIAHGLSQVCRFAAQTSKFYSVAQHSVLVSRLVPREFARVGLLHDAPEAYIGDMAKPLKRLLPEYDEVEARIYRAIARKFDLPYKIPGEVKDVDARLLANEGVAVMSEDWRGAQYDPDPAMGTVYPLEPREAKQLFLERHQELFG